MRPRSDPIIPHTASSLDNLALNCIANGASYDEAEPLFARALAIREAALGPDHPSTAYKPQQSRLAASRPGRA